MINLDLTAFRETESYAYPVAVVWTRQGLPRTPILLYLRRCEDIVIRGIPPFDPMHRGALIERVQHPITIRLNIILH